MGEERLSYLLEILSKRGGRIKLIRDHTFQNGWKGQTHERVVTGVDHHLVLEMPDVLDWVASSGSKVKVVNFSRIHTPELLRREESKTLVVTHFGLLRSCSLAFLIRLWTRSSRVQM